MDLSILIIIVVVVETNCRHYWTRPIQYLTLTILVSGFFFDFCVCCSVQGVVNNNNNKCPTKIILDFCLLDQFNTAATTIIDHRRIFQSIVQIYQQKYEPHEKKSLAKRHLFYMDEWIINRCSVYIDINFFFRFLFISVKEIELDFAWMNECVCVCVVRIVEFPIGNQCWIV